jgi:hypothetical protein
MKAKPIVPRSEANRDVDEAIDVWRVLHGNVTFQHGWLTTLTQTSCSNVGQIKRVARLLIGPLLLASPVRVNFAAKLPAKSHSIANHEMPQCWM